MKILLSIFTFLPLLLCGQITIVSSGSNTENFNALAATGSVNTFANNSTIPNWFSQRSTSSILYAASDGSGTSGGLYSYGSTGSSERALGTKGSGNGSYGGNFAHGVLLQNNSGYTLTNLQIGYTLEQWRKEIKTNADTIKVYYKISTTPILLLNPGVTSGWTEINSLRSTNPIITPTGSGGALNGNLSANRVLVPSAAIPNLQLADGSYIHIKWEDPDHSGEDISLAIDDVQLNWTVGCNTSATLNETACVSYTSPSGNYTYTQSGTYYDTIPNAGGCDSLLTINLLLSSSITYYADTDQDGFGNSQNTVQGCSIPVGYVTNGIDCDDTNPSIGAPTLTVYADSDGDGYGAGIPQQVCTIGSGYSINNLDCDDANPSIYPTATEIPGNGIDEDCDGADANPIGAELARYEFTGIGVCPILADTVNAQPTDAQFSTYQNVGASCSATSNVFNNSGWNTTVNVDLQEYNTFSIQADSCKILDINRIIFTHKCSNSGVGTIPPTWSIRTSIDGFTTPIGTGPIQTTDRTDTVYLNSDFDQLTQITFRFYVSNMGSSQATWRNDNVRIVGNISSATPLVYYADTDQDGFGDAQNATTSCSPPTGYVANNTDCNDSVNWINPTTTWYQDADQDTYGASNSFIVACIQPAGYVRYANDCDDTNPAIGLGTPYYADADLDGYGTGTAINLCTPTIGFASQNGDCNDANSAIHPGQTDIPANGIDENCDGVDGTAEIEENTAEVVLLYPNPAFNNLHLVFDGAAKRIIEMRDIQGKLLMTTSCYEGTISLPVFYLQTGTYFITIQGNGKRMTHLFIRE